MKKFLAFLVIFMVGCVTSTQTTITGNGVSINTFGSDLPDYVNGDKVEIGYEIQNNGGTEATNVWALLFGLNTVEWSIDSATKNPTKVASSLEGPLEDAKLPGDSETGRWKLRAPNVPQGISQNYNALLRVFYSYGSKASATVPIITEDEFKRMRSNNEAMPNIGTTFISKGPLSIHISARAPEVMRNDTDTFRVVINIENNGGGSVFEPSVLAGFSEGSEASASVSQDNMNKFRIKVDAQGVTESDCAALGSDQTESLRNGKSMTYNCELKITRRVPRLDVPITVFLTYGYQIDRTSTLKVSGNT